MQEEIGTPSEVTVDAPASPLWPAESGRSQRAVIGQPLDEVKDLPGVKLQQGAAVESVVGSQVDGDGGAVPF